MTTTESEAAQSAASAKRVLLVDDNAPLREAAAEFLRLHGFVVIEAGTGSEALATMKTQPVGVVVTDIFMPDMDGFQLMMELRRVHPKVGIVAISGGNKFDPEQYLAIARKLGVRRTLSKPFSLAELAATVSAIAAEEA